MPHQIYFHLVWTTRDRRPLICREIAAFLDRMLRAIAKQERAQVLALGMVTTHVHLLLRAHPMTPIPRLLQRLKGASSALAGKELGLPPRSQLRWAAGYTIHSVSPSAVETVREYVRNQAARHPHEVIRGWVRDPAVERDQVAVTTVWETTWGVLRGQNSTSNQLMADKLKLALGHSVPTGRRIAGSGREMQKFSRGAIASR